MTNAKVQSNQFSIWPVYRTLSGIGMACGLLIVGVYLGTAPAIEENRAFALQQAIFNVLPGTKATQTYRYSLENGGSLILLSEDEAGIATDDLIFAGFDQQNKLVGLALQTQGQGYQDVISILYGYDPNQQVIIGLKVLESRETPGLGDKIEKDINFINNFKRLDVVLNDKNTDLKHAIEAVKSGQKEAPWQIDGITGATISSVAIAQMLDANVRIWAPRIKANQQELTKIAEDANE